MRRKIVAALLCLPLSAWGGDAALHLSPGRASNPWTVQATTWHGQKAIRIPMVFHAGEWKRAGFGGADSKAEPETAWLYVTATSFQLQDSNGTPLMGGPRADLELDRSHCVKMRSISNSVCGYVASSSSGDNSTGSMGSTGARQDEHEFLKEVTKDFRAAYKQLASNEATIDEPSFVNSGTSAPASAAVQPSPVQPAPMAVQPQPGVVAGPAEPVASSPSLIAAPVVEAPPALVPMPTPAPAVLSAAPPVEAPAAPVSAPAPVAAAPAVSAPVVPVTAPAPEAAPAEAKSESPAVEPVAAPTPVAAAPVEVPVPAPASTPAPEAAITPAPAAMSAPASAPEEVKAEAPVPSPTPVPAPAPVEAPVAVAPAPAAPALVAAPAAPRPDPLEAVKALTSKARPEDLTSNGGTQPEATLPEPAMAPVALTAPSLPIIPIQPEAPAPVAAAPVPAIIVPAQPAKEPAVSVATGFETAAPSAAAVSVAPAGAVRSTDGFNVVNSRVEGPTSADDLTPAGAPRGATPEEPASAVHGTQGFDVVNSRAAESVTTHADDLTPAGSPKGAVPEPAAEAPPVPAVVSAPEPPAVVNPAPVVVAAPAPVVNPEPVAVAPAPTPVPDVKSVPAESVAVPVPVVAPAIAPAAAAASVAPPSSAATHETQGFNVVNSRTEASAVPAATDDLTPAGAPRGAHPETASEMKADAAAAAAVTAAREATLVEAEHKAAADHKIEEDLAKTPGLAVLPESSEVNSVPVEKTAVKMRPHLTTTTVFTERTKLASELPAANHTTATPAPAQGFAAPPTTEKPVVRPPVATGASSLGFDTPSAPAKPVVRPPVATNLDSQGFAAPPAAAPATAPAPANRPPVKSVTLPSVVAPSQQ